MPGHSHDFVLEPEERFLCNICMDVMRNPVETQCGHSYCEGCLKEALNNRPVCPMCLEQVGDGATHPLVGLAREINNLDVHCPNRDKGCTHTATLQRIDDHVLDTCPFHLVDCPQFCGSRIARRNVDLHVTQACLYRLVHCDRCGDTMQASHFGDHIDDCKVDLHPTGLENGEASRLSEQTVDGYSRNHSQTNFDSSQFFGITVPGEETDQDPAQRERSSPLGCFAAYTDSPLTQCRRSLAPFCRSTQSGVYDDENTQAGDSERGICAIIKRQSRKRLLIAAAVIVSFITIVVPACAVTIYFVTRDTSVLSKACTIGSDPCSDDSGLDMTCDRSKHTCLLNVGETCKGDNKDLCVSGATCDKNSKRCTCKDGFRELDDVCALKRGERCSGGREDLCWTGEYCDIYDTDQCQCLDHYHPSGDFCLLKAEIPDVDCSTVTPCVEHAKCDRKTGQCLCDKDYRVRWDGLCGLRPFVKVSSCDGVECFGGTVCVVTGATSAQCQCADHHHWESGTNQCEPDESTCLRPSWLFVLSAALLCLALTSSSS